MRKRTFLVAAILILVLSWSFTALAQEDYSVWGPIILRSRNLGGSIPPTPTPVPPADTESSVIETLLVDGGGEMGQWVIAL